MGKNGIEILKPDQISALGTLLHRGSQDASEMLGKWVGKPSVVFIDSLEQMDLVDAPDLLQAEDPMCFCSTELSGLLNGELILAFDDNSGLELADLLLGQTAGTSQDWSDMAKSAALETTNILACSYLNSIAASFSTRDKAAECLPSAPVFSRDYASSLLEFALMGQAVASEKVLLAKTCFEVDGTLANWTLLLIPDAPSMSRLATLLSELPPATGDSA